MDVVDIGGLDRQRGRSGVGAPSKVDILYKKVHSYGDPGWGSELATIVAPTVAASQRNIWSIRHLTSRARPRP